MTASGVRRSWETPLSKALRTCSVWACTRASEAASDIWSRSIARASWLAHDSSSRR